MNGILEKNPLRRLLQRIFPAGEVYYINGPQTLPPPLSHEEEAELLDRLAIDEGARSILVERNLRLVVYIAKKFEGTAVGIEDLISIGTIGLMKAVNTFRPDRQIKLATYASRCIENEILMFLRKNAGIKTELSLDEPLNVDYDGNELLLSDMLGTEVDEVCKELEVKEEKSMVRKALALERLRKVSMAFEPHLSDSSPLSRHQRTTSASIHEVSSSCVGCRFPSAS